MTLREYRYSLLRFVPGIARGEAANVGVIVVDDTAGETASAFLPDSTAKIAALAPGFNVAGITDAIEAIRRRVDPECRSTSETAWVRSSEQLRVLAGTMKNQLQLSEPKACRAVSLEEAARELYEQLVRPIGAATTETEVRAVAS